MTEQELIELWGDGTQFGMNTETINSQIKTINSQIKTIKAVADAILKTHKNSTETFKGVNYGDLRIVDVSYNLHLDGEEGYSVFIEECSPTAYEFQEFMLECLKDKLGFYVNVVLEW